MDLAIQIEKLEKEIQAYFKSDSSGHDIYHLKRVMNIALHIQEKEGGDRTVIGIAALLHDVHRIMQNETGCFCLPKDSLDNIKEIIDKSDIILSRKQIDMVLHCIEYHEEYSFSKSGKTVSDIETLILQDADNLDAIGAIGVGRTMTYGATLGIPIWNPDINDEKKTFDEGDKEESTIHHFYNKLFKLKDNMNTSTAKAIAQKRHEFMEQFVEEFLAEWEGKR